MDMKRIMIFGDSYSTFEGYIPKGYAAYYTKDHTITDVRRVNDTWWKKLTDEIGAEIVMNDSWSGSTICYTGYNNTDCSRSSSFIYRLNRYAEENFFEGKDIDAVFVFGGTNDSWADVNVGRLQYSDWEKQDLHNVLPAVCFFMKRLKEELPKARIIWLINTELKEEVASGMETACGHYGIDYVRFTDIDKAAGHPTVKGMKMIKDEVLNAVREMA